MLSLLAMLLPLAQAAPLRIESPDDTGVCRRISRAHAAAISYGADGQVVSIGCTYDGVPDGPYTSWYPSGKKKSQGAYRDGTLVGGWTRWREDGTLVDRGPWLLGEPHGLWFKFDEKGKTREAGYFEYGARACEWRYRDAKGKVRRRWEGEAVQGCESDGLKPRSFRGWGLVAGLGFSSVSYTEGPVELSMVALTPKVDFSYDLWTGFQMAANAYLTALPLGSQVTVGGSERTDLAARFVGANLRLGYVLPWLPRPWTASLAVGLFYSKMLVTSSLFGYGNLLYPELYPTVRRQLGAGALSAYLKFVPLGSSPLSFSFDTREIAFGLAYERPLSIFGRHHVVFSFDVASLQIQPSNSPHVMKTGSVTLGAGYRL